MFDTTKEIIEKLSNEQKTPAAQQAINTIPTELLEECRQEVAALQHKYHLTLFNWGNTDISLPRLRQELSALWQIEQKAILKQERERTIIEKYKLAIIKTLKTQLSRHLANKNPPPIQPSAKKWPFFRLLLFGLLALFGLFMDAIGSFNASKDLLSLIPGLAYPWLLGLSAALTFINSILFCAFELGLLKQGLDISYSLQDKTYFEILSKQIDEVEQLNRLFFDVTIATKIEPTYYQSLANVINALNQDLANKKEQLDFKEQAAKKLLRYLLVAFGALMVSAGGYFMADSFLISTAPSLIGTTFGWAFIGVSIISSLGFYCFMEASSMFRMLNPSYQKFSIAKKKLKKITLKDPEDFENAVKEKLEKSLTSRIDHGRENGITPEPKPAKVLIDAATQTEESALAEANKSSYGLDLANANL